MHLFKHTVHLFSLMPSEHAVAGSLPLTETTFYILLSLSPGSSHGYAILKDVERLSGGRLVLSTGTLYGALKRLLERGWIERVPDGTDETSAPVGKRARKSYALTELGERVLEAETSRMEVLVTTAKVRASGASV